MPFLVTTKRPCGAQFGRCKDPDHADTSRVAVATREEARNEVEIAASASLPHEYWQEVATFVRLCSSVGPLPDGTTITVEPVTWRALWERAGCPNRPDGEPSEQTHGRLIAAYNAAQEARA